MSNEAVLMNKGLVLELLASTRRDGMAELIRWLDVNGFFECPASSRFHGCFVGGLAQHSLNVYARLNSLVALVRVPVPEASVVIASLLHDVCKCGAYFFDEAEGRYRVSTGNQPGHAALSLSIIQRFVQLSTLEAMMIRFHMGVYGCREFSEKRGEYSLKDLTDAIEAQPVKLMCMADELATMAEQHAERGAPGRGPGLHPSQNKACPHESWFRGNGIQPSGMKGGAE